VSTNALIGADYNVCDCAVKFLSVIFLIPPRIIVNYILQSISSGEIKVKYLFETFWRVLRERVKDILEVKKEIDGTYRPILKTNLDRHSKPT
jgi:hypothetical protein